MLLLARRTFAHSTAQRGARTLSRSLGASPPMASPSGAPIGAQQQAGGPPSPAVAIDFLMLLQNLKVAALSAAARLCCKSPPRWQSARRALPRLPLSLSHHARRSPLSPPHAASAAPPRPFCTRHVPHSPPAIGANRLRAFQLLPVLFAALGVVVGSANLGRKKASRLGVTSRSRAPGRGQIDCTQLEYAVSGGRGVRGGGSAGGGGRAMHGAAWRSDTSALSRAPRRATHATHSGKSLVDTPGFDPGT